MCQRFVSRIAMGNYDAFIISHSQFEKIPISRERQKQLPQVIFCDSGTPKQGIFNVYDELKRQYEWILRISLPGCC